MKVLVILLSLSAAVWTRPQGQSPDADARIIGYDFENTDDGGYKYWYETTNGIQRDETAVIAREGSESILRVSGTYSYLGPDGVLYTVKYTADENGFRPQGTHIPQSAGVTRPVLGIPSAALASLAGGGLG